MTKNTAKDVLFVMSVDTEEEWDWDGAFPEENCSVNNIHQLPAFHAHCQQLGIRPTYLTDYAVASNPKSAAALKQILADNDSELGAHLHPWCNPPYYGETNEFASHVVNLPVEHVEAKLAALIEKLTKVFERQPRSFRTGRWGVDGNVLQLLSRYGIDIDSSVYPFYQNEFFSCQQSPLDSYWPDFNDPLRPGAQRDILQVPVSVGFNRSNFRRSEQLYRLISETPLRHFRLVGLFWQLKLLRKIYLSPELCTASEMKGLVDALLKRGRPVLHMYLHSSSLLDGVTGLLDATGAQQEICRRISAVIQHLQTKDVNVQFCTLSEAKDILATRNAGEGILQ